MNDIETSSSPAHPEPTAAGSEYVDLPPQEEPTFPNTTVATVANGIVRYRLFGATDVGLVREHNEDNFLVADLDLALRGIEDETIRTGVIGGKGVVVAVCDGMGGAAAGEVASQMAVDTLHELFAASEPTSDREEFARRLVIAVEEAGNRIFNAARLDRSRRGMGTTATVAGLIDSVLFVGQVGDSRCYVLRNSKLSLVTKDQSLVNQLIEAGQLTEEEAEAFEHSNIILQALGTTERVVVDLTFVDLHRGDRVMLCSDGLSGLVHSEMIRDVLATIEDPRDAAAKLIEYANNGGGHDNITCVIVDFDGEGLLPADTSSSPSYQQYPLLRPDLPPPVTEHDSTLRNQNARPPAEAYRPPSLTPNAMQVGAPEFPWWLVAAAGIVLLLLGGAAWYLARPPEPPPPPVVVPLPTQSVRLRTNDTTGDLTLYVDGTPVNSISAGSPLDIQLPVGRHRFELRDPSDRVVGEAAYEVHAGNTEDFMIETTLP